MSLAFAIDHGPSESSDAAPTRLAPGKRTLTQAIQRKAAPSAPAPAPEAGPVLGALPDPFDFSFATGAGLAGGGGALPFLDTLAPAFGPAHDLSGITAHVGGPAADACDRLGAAAYATGSHVAFRGAPDLHTAAHEAAHVVQQRAGVQLLGGLGVDGDPYERHADAVADRVVAGGSAAELLADVAGLAGGGGAAVQCKTLDDDDAYQAFHAALSPLTRQLIERELAKGGALAGTTWSTLAQATGKSRAWLEGYVAWLGRAGAATTTHATEHADASQETHKETHQQTKLQIDGFGGMVWKQQLLAEMLDHLVAQQGGTVELTTQIDISIEGVYGGITLTLEAERTDDGFEVAGGVTFALGLGTADDYIAITGATGVAGKGDDAYEAVNLAGLGLDLSIRPLGGVLDASLLRELATKGIAGTIVSHTVGNTIANVLWGRGYVDAMVANMDDDDEARRTNSIGVEGKADLEVAEGGVSAEFQSDDVWKAGDGGAGVEHSVENQLVFKAGLGVDLGPGGQFELQASATAPSTEHIILGLELSIGLKGGLSITSPAAVGEGARGILQDLISYSPQLGDSWFGAVVDGMCTAIDYALRLDEAMSATWFSVEGTYDSVTGELEVVVSTAFKVDQKLGGGEFAVTIKASKTTPLYQHTFDVGTL